MKESPSFQPSENRIEGTPLLSTSRDKKISEVRRDISQSLEKHPGYIPHELDNPKVSVQKIPEMGRAVFAREPIHAGEIIAAFVGTVHRAKKISELPNDPPDYMRDHVIQIGEEEYLHGKGGLAELINHSCEPNCGIKDLSKVVTMRDIKAGEQLTWDYAMTEDSDWYLQGCLCGSEACRGTIGPYRDLPEEKKEKYWEFTSEWLRKKYRSNISEKTEMHQEYHFQTLTSESSELTPELIREFANAFRLAFNNPPYNQYLFYPSEGRPISPQEAMGLPSTTHVGLDQLDCFDLDQFPRHPTTGEKALWWTDRKITKQKLEKKLKKNAYMTIVRDPNTSSILGATYARACSLREAFEEEEWKNPFYYSQLQEESTFRDFEHFFKKVSDFAKERLGCTVTPESTILCYNCVFVDPHVQGKGIFLSMVREFLTRLPKNIRHLKTISEMIIGTKAHHIYTACGMHPISGIFNSEGQLKSGDAVIALSHLDELINNFSLPKDQFKKLLKTKHHPLM